MANLQTESESPAPPLSRVERKRQEARERIIAAARTLFLARGVESVTISDITTKADVGHGSFYLHFKSKHEVLLPIMIADAAEMDARLQASLASVTDPAEVLASSARYMGYRIVRDELWRWFLQHSGLPTEDMRRTFGAFSERDFQTGLDSGRFVVAEAKVTAQFCFGGYVSVLLMSMQAAEPDSMIDAAVEALLRGFGLSAEDARHIVQIPIEHI